MDDDNRAATPRCVGSTGDFYRCSVRETLRRKAMKSNQNGEQGQRLNDGREAHEESNFFKSAQWTADGTCILTNSEDNHLRTFVLPPDLLEKDTPHDLTPYLTLPSPEPIYTSTIYPLFNLQGPSTTLILSTTRDHPIRLSSVLHPSLLASYPLVSPTTEAYITPHSILFTPDGTHFVTGSDSLICCFDISRSGKGPITRMPTIPSKRKKIVGGGVGMKGIISALAWSTDTILAAGTFTRSVGLYDSGGQGDCIAVFSVAHEANDTETQIGGSGITQVLWSPCGRYLYVAERKSNGIIVYDIRVAGKRLGSLQGRKSDTNQRLGVDIVQTEQGHEIWAGGTDGVVRVWQNPGEEEGAKDPKWEWKAHDDPVTSAVVHPFGSVLATCSGQRHTNALAADVGDTEVGEDSDSDESSSSAAAASSSSTSLSSSSKPSWDNRLMIWSL